MRQLSADACDGTMAKARHALLVDETPEKVQSSKKKVPPMRVESVVNAHPEAFFHLVST